MDPLVALDIETTGLDPTLDALIEVAAIRFRGSRVEDTWSTLINPGRPLPPQIVALTGISDEMLANAPRVTAVLGDLEQFVGDLPILGHNIGFDVGFLRPYGLFPHNQTLDTYDLAAVLLPSAGRYGLSALANALGIPLRTSHRALEDAQTTRQVFLRLYEEALKLPPALLLEVARLGANIEWGAGWVFESLLDEIDTEEMAAPPLATPITFDSPLPMAPSRTLPIRADTLPLDSEALASMVEPGGAVARALPGFEHRSQQVTMLHAVSEALSLSQHLMVEAGTGTGKSMAYLIPAFTWADQNGKRVVISTNTINLQDQLIHKDVPDINLALGTEFRAAVLKGRANYLCPRRLASMRQLGPRNEDEIRALAKILVWLQNGGRGDRSEINLPPREFPVWTRLSAEGEECSLDACQEHAAGACPYFQARQAAEHSHVVIVNHALLLADIMTGNRVIPPFDYLIIDEAHHVESATTRGLSFRVHQREAEFLLKDLGSSSSGMLGQIIRVAQTILDTQQFKPLVQSIEALSDRLHEGQGVMQSTFNALLEFLERQRSGKPVGRYGQQMRVVPSTRTLPNWSEVEIAWEKARDSLHSALETLGEISEGLQAIADDGHEAAENLASAFRIAVTQLGGIFENLDRMIFEPDPQTIYWIQLDAGSNQVSLHAAPLDIGPLMERYIWHEKESVILTSATLTTGGEFDYIRSRLRADEAHEIALGSPFDYERSTLLYVVNDIPEPTDRRLYQRDVENGLIALCRATRGRALVLFTSHEQLMRTARAISEPLAKDGIDVLEQRSGASRHALLEQFRSGEASVLLGTRSFWEGVDVPGEALSVLAMVRLPFDVPSDPIISARAELFESPFDEYTVPEAILRFRQGFGRLIRTRDDRGVVAIFDRRVDSKRYGAAFIESLPRCTMRKGPLRDLPADAARWLAA